MFQNKPKGIAMTDFESGWGVVGGNFITWREHAAADGTSPSTMKRGITRFQRKMLVLPLKRTGKGAEATVRKKRGGRKKKVSGV